MDTDKLTNLIKAAEAALEYLEPQAGPGGKGLLPILYDALEVAIEEAKEASDGK